MIKKLVLGAVLALLTSCSTHTRSIEVRQEEPMAQYRTETVEETEVAHEHTGIISGTVHVLGEIIALPFRAVAALFDVLF